MKDITSFEKTKTLNAAGVMPPTVEVGQFYYISGKLFVVLAIKQPYAAVYLCEGSTIYELMTHEHINDLEIHHTYAFTPSDLLPLLPPDTIVQMWGGKPSVKFTLPDGELRIEGENLADIMADALLKTLAT